MIIWFYSLKIIQQLSGLFKKKLGGHTSRHAVILVPQPGIEATLPALEGRVLTAGPPGKSLIGPFLGETVIGMN